MASIFTQIINGNIPSYKIAENDRFYAFLDIAPLVKGHTLVVPKNETDKAFDLSAELLGEWLQFAQPIAKAIEAVMDCNRCGFSVLGLEVPHAHLHLVPINSADDLNFTRPKLKLTSDEMTGIRDLIVSRL